MKILNTVLVILFILTAQSVEAQFLKKIKKAVKDKVENKAADKIADKAAEKTGEAIDDAFEDGDENKKKDKNAGMGNILGGMMKNVDIEDHYTFTISVKLEVTEYGRKEKKNTVNQSYGDNVHMTSVEAQQLIITDMNNEAAIIINDKDKTAQVMSMSWMSKMMEGAELGAEDESKIDFKKTGRTAIKHGYKVEEYIINHDEGKAEIWFAPDVEFNYEDFMSGFAKLFKKSLSGNIPMSQGYVMEMTSYDKKGKKENKMEVLEVSKSKNKIDMGKYEIQKMF